VSLVDVQNNNVRTSPTVRMQLIETSIVAAADSAFEEM
jgi:hypothetical protein